jgi:RNA polymerase sigma factor (sigma-70 family)
VVHPAHRLLTDERLAALAADGDERAFATLYRRHEAVLLRYCRSITGDRDDAGDALQNAMLRALGAITRKAPKGPVRPWLFRIAHNESINVLRRRRGEVRMADPEPNFTAAGADERTVEREALREVVAEIVRLPARQRGALVLRELEGLEYREVASALDVTEVNARQLVFAARSGLVESAAGRQLSCADVRCELADGDLRARRRKRLRAHLRSCDSCRAYASAHGPKRRVAAFLPNWLIGWTGLHGVLGSSTGVAGSGAGEVAAKGAATLAVVAAAAAAGPTAVDHARHGAQHAPSAQHASAAPKSAAKAVPAPIASAAAAPTAPTRAAATSTAPRSAAATGTRSDAKRAARDGGDKGATGERPIASAEGEGRRTFASGGDGSGASRGHDHGGRQSASDDGSGDRTSGSPDPAGADGARTLASNSDSRDGRGGDHGTDGGWRRNADMQQPAADSPVRAARDCPPRQDAPTATQPEQPAQPAPADSQPQPL